MRKKHCWNEARNAPTTRRGTALRRSAGLIHGMLFANFPTIDEPFKAHVHVILCRFWLGKLPDHTHTFHSLPPKKRKGLHADIYRKQILSAAVLPDCTGGCALYLDLSGQGFRHGRLFRSSRRPAAAGSRRAAPFPDAGGFPRILSGYAFQMPGSRPAADP